MSAQGQYRDGIAVRLKRKPVGGPARAKPKVGGCRSYGDRNDPGKGVMESELLEGNG